EQCDSYNISSYFDEILGIDNIHAAGKIEIALKFMKEHQIKGEDVLFVGDTLHDLEVGKAMGASVMLVSCGHQSIEVLKQGGVPIIDSTYDLVSRLERVS
ncbi:MAG: HAD hydrolase-like protein, partial [Anaeroplasmataceae bacterium]|nr:HAD hydrolase-like protein [Anaeroplasmataceae bacterium]